MLLWGLRALGVITLTGVAWTVLLAYGLLEGWFVTRDVAPGDYRGFMSAVREQVASQDVGNLSLVLIQAGKPVDEIHQSRDGNVNGDTRYQVASLSKWLTACGVMKLVEEGRVDLDMPVSDYLTRWTLPASGFDHRKVTVRRLLSHTAGLTDGLGFAGYEPGVPLPTIEDALAHPNATQPDATIAVGMEPGSTWAYSGGGYLILQLLIEEVSGESFEAYMQRAILTPFGMTRSTFLYPADETNLALSYDTDGSVAPLYRFVARGAAGLYTTTADMTRFLAAHTGARTGPLTEVSLAAMRRPEAEVNLLDTWGLGVMLVVPTDSGDFVVGHGGQNDPAILTSAVYNPDTGDALVALSSGNRFLVPEIVSRWSAWQTGRPDLFAMVMGTAFDGLWLPLFGGWAVIVVLVVGFGVRRRLLVP